MTRASDNGPTRPRPSGSERGRSQNSSRVYGPHTRSHLSSTDLDAVRGLARDLAVIDLDGPPVARWLSDRLLSVLRTEHTMIYTPSWKDGAYRLERFAIAGAGREREAAVRDLFGEHIRRSTGFWSTYDPANVELAQRNKAIAGGTHKRANEGQVSAPFTRLMPRAELDRRIAILSGARTGFELWGTYDAETIRALICDGPRLLGWVGALQHQRLDPRIQRLFTALLPSIQRRFTIEERLGVGTAGLPLAFALLEEIPGAVYILDGKHQVVACNSTGKAALQRDPRWPKKISEVARRGGDPSSTLVDLESRGVVGHSLLVVRVDPIPVPVALEVVAKRYRLTPREAAVLREVGRGRTNRAIGVALGCAERTVETHVSRILEKTDQASRTELAALAWSAGVRPT